MSIGRIEMVDGKKQYVRYATLGGGGSGGVPVGNVQDLALEESVNSLTLTWKDPDNVVFNGEEIAEWAGTKVVRKEGSQPTSVEDGTLIADSTVKDQYSVDGLQDIDVVSDAQYNYALFPYTSKNVYTMSDINRVSGRLQTVGYDSVLANNTWEQIDEASRSGIAKYIWSIGDTKDDCMIIGFDHDDLSDGSGKAGITFIVGESYMYKGALDGRTGSTYYAYPNLNLLQTGLNAVISKMSVNIKNVVKKVKKKYYTAYKTTTNNTVGSSDMNYFLISVGETNIFDNEIWMQLGDGYEGLKIDLLTMPTCNWWTRDVIESGRVRYITNANGISYTDRYQSFCYVRPCFCV